MKDERPTKPAGPNALRACVHCGRPYGEHAQTAAPQNTTHACKGTRKGYEDATRHRQK